MQRSSFEIVKYLLEKNNFHFDSSKIKLQLLSSPDSENFKSVSDTFDYFDIPNIVANVPLDSLKELPDTFLCVLSISEKKHVAVATQSKNSIELFFSDRKKRKISIEEFTKMWDGTILAIEMQERRTKKIKLSTLLIIGSLILFSLPIFVFNQEPYRILFVCTSLLGVFFSYMIIKKELNINDYFSSKFCSTLGSQSGCSAVINSSYSKIFKNVTIGDICIIYFSSLTLISNFVSFLILPFAITTFLSLISIPFSVYYQSRVIKQWCCRLPPFRTP